MRTQLSALLAIALACTFFAATANAQSIRTFVSVAGSDSNPCSITQPCRHFQTAVNATAVGGEVDALDPGAYGSFTISQAITIEGQGWSYVAPPANGAAITITASSGTVTIRGVSLNGIGVAGAYGIVFNSGAELQVINCVVRNFAANGISFGPTVSSTLVVSNTFIASNAFQGVIVAPQAANLTVRAVLNRVELHNNFRGLYVYDFANSGGTIDVSAVDTVASNNSTNGFEVETTAVGSPVTHLSLVRVTAAENGGAGVAAEGPQSTIRLAESLLTANGQGWAQNGGSLVVSYGNNFIDGNTNDTPAPPHISME
jgi:hypothetical protein